MPKRRKSTKSKQSFNKGLGSGLLLALIIIFGGYIVFQGMQEGEENNEEEENEEVTEEDVQTDEKIKVGIKEPESEELEKKEEEKEIGGSGDEKTDEEIAKEAEEATKNEAPGALTKSYQNDNYAYTVKYPNNWQKEETAGQVGFLPPSKESTERFDGDIIINHKENPEDLSIKEQYDGTKDINLFQDAIGGYENIKNGYMEAYKFSDVQGYVPSTVVVIKTVNGFVEITDVGAQHQKDGVFEEMVASFNVK